MRYDTYKGISTHLAQIIKGSMWEGHVFLVGGCIRDEMMHCRIHDVDIAVDTPNGGIRFARWLQKKHFTSRGRSLQVFIHFGTAKVQLRQFPQEVIDCVQTRRDRYEYDDNPHPSENYGTIEEDAIRRDLTINSLYMNISTGELLDPTGYGLADIRNHVIRTPNNPDITFNDNAMHILRCIRFAVRYDWTLPEELLDAMKRNIAILQEARPKRLVKEITAMLELKNKDKALQLINDIGAGDVVRPVVELIENMPPEEQPVQEKPARKKRKHRRRRKPAANIQTNN